MTSENDVPHFAQGQLYAGAAAITVGGALAFGALFMLRGGLGDNAAQVGGLFGMAILPVWLSTAALSRFSRAPLGAAIAALLGLVAGIFLPVFSLALGPAALALCIAVLLACIALNVGRVGAALRPSIALTLITLVSGALILLLGSPLRLFMQEALTLGIASSDNYWHAAIMQMIAKYRSVAIGADGLVHQNYHYLFHILVASQAMATVTDIPLVYGYWSALTLKLELVWGLFCAGWLLFRVDGDDRSAACWRLAYAWIAAILAWGFEMESYLLGIVTFVAWLPLLLALLRAAPRAGRSTAAGITLACAAAFLCAMAKTSAGYYCAIGLILLLWHYRGYKKLVLLIGISLAALAGFAHGLLLPKEVLISGTAIPILVISYLMYFQRGILLHYFLPAALAAIFAWRPRRTLTVTSDGTITLNITCSPVAASAAPLPGWIQRGSGLIKPLRWLALKDVETQLLILALSGTLFVLFFIPLGDNVWDFSDVLFALALLLLPVALGETLDIRLSGRIAKAVLSAVLAGYLAWVSAIFVFDGQTSLPQTLVALYRPALGTEIGKPSGTKHDIALSLKTTHQPFSRLKDAINATPAKQLQGLLDKEADSVGGRLAVHIAPKAEDMWRVFEKASPEKWCLYPQLFIPSTMGLVEIRSIPPARIQQTCMTPGMVWYGYGKRQDQHRTADFTPQQLCAMGKPMDIRKIYRLVSFRDLSRNTVVTCR